MPIKKTAEKEMSAIHKSNKTKIPINRLKELKDLCDENYNTHERN